MSGDLSLIGAFQFANLVYNRIPFLLLHEEMDFKELFGPLERDHLQRWGIVVDFSQDLASVLPLIEERKFPKQSPVVLLGKAGESGRPWVQALEAFGYSNVYWVTGGWEELKKTQNGI